MSSSSSFSPNEIRAAAETHRELGPDYRDAVVDSFLDKVGREIDARVDGNAQPQAVVLDVNGMVSTERRTIAANWSALRFVTRDKELHPLLDLSDAQINATPPYASDKPIRAVSPPPPPTPVAASTPAAASRAIAVSSVRAVR